MRARSCCRAERCSEDNRFSLRTALASSAERAHVGRRLAVMQAFGQLLVRKAPSAASCCRRWLRASGIGRSGIEEAIGEHPDVQCARETGEHRAKPRAICNHDWKGIKFCRRSIKCL